MAGLKDFDTDSESVAESGESSFESFESLLKSQRNSVEYTG